MQNSDKSRCNQLVNESNEPQRLVSHDLNDGANGPCEMETAWIQNFYMIFITTGLTKGEEELKAAQKYSE